MSEQLKSIQKILKATSNAAALAAHRKFVPGIGAKIYGVRNPVLNEIARSFRTGGFSLAKELWDTGAYEEKLVAVKLLGLIAKKDAARALELIQYFAPGIDNWAVCDAIGMQGLKPILKTEQEAVFAIAEKYNLSQNYWERRLSLVLVEWYTRDPALHPRIKKLVTPLENDPEYYVRKAVSWINRNFEKGK